MKINEKRQGAVTIIQPTAALISADADLFGQAATRALTGSLGRVVVDLSAVAFVDSRGLEVLLDLAEEVERGGRTLKLCMTNATVRQVIELTGLVPHFEYFDDTHSAVRSFL
jgi:anti-anti-sigma factor